MCFSSGNCIAANLAFLGSILIKLVIQLEVLLVFGNGTLCYSADHETMHVWAACFCDFALSAALAVDKDEFGTYLKNGRSGMLFPKTPRALLSCAASLMAGSYEGKTEDEVSGKVILAMSGCGTSFRSEELAEMVAGYVQGA